MRCQIDMLLTNCYHIGKYILVPHIHRKCLFFDVKIYNRNLVCMVRMKLYFIDTIRQIYFDKKLSSFFVSPYPYF